MFNYTVLFRTSAHPWNKTLKQFRRVEKYANEAETVSMFYFSFVSPCATGFRVYLLTNERPLAAAFCCHYTCHRCFLSVSLGTLLTRARRDMPSNVAFLMCACIPKNAVQNEMRSNYHRLSNNRFACILIKLYLESLTHFKKQNFLKRAKNLIRLPFLL